MCRGSYGTRSVPATFASRQSCPRNFPRFTSHSPAGYRVVGWWITRCVCLRFTNNHSRQQRISTMLAKALRRRFESRPDRPSARRAQCSHSRHPRLESLEPRMMLTATPGTWTPLAHIPPTTNVGTMELLSDGTVMAAAAELFRCQYLVQTDSRRDRQLCQRHLVADGERYRQSLLRRRRTCSRTAASSSWEVCKTFASGANVYNNTGDIYNPVANTWTAIPNFPEPNFGGPSMLLPDGRVLAGSMTWPEYLHLRSGLERLVCLARRSSITTRAFTKPGPNCRTAASCRTT